MRLLVFSDIHGDLSALRALMNTEADYYFAAGDLVSWARGFEKVGPVLQERSGRVYVIPGNHESEGDIARLCQEYGLQNFHRQQMKIGAYAVAGLGYSNPTPFNTPGEYSEEELARHLAAFDDAHPRVVVCHCPPQGTSLDETRPGQHFGSRAVRDFIERAHPEYFFCGHIHEAAGRSERLGATQAWNVGKKGYVLEL